MRVRLPISGRLLLLALFVLAPALMGPKPADTTSREASSATTRTQWRNYEVRKGDTLTVIAKKLRCDVDELQKWNQKALSRKRFIFPGQKLRYARTVRVQRVRKAPTRAAAPRIKPVASKQHTRRKVAAAIGLKPLEERQEQATPAKPEPELVPPPAAREEPTEVAEGAGDEAGAPSTEPKRSKPPVAGPAGPPPSYIISADKTQAESIGAPGKGRLKNGVEMPLKGVGFRRINHKRKYGADQTVALVKFVAARVAEEYPGTRPMLVGALSKEGGGRVRPHKSHQNGLDVDIAYFEKGNPKRKHYKARVRASEIDYPKTWFMLETMLLTGKVNYMFIDKPLHKGLRKAASDAGWPDDAIEGIFGDEDNKGRGRIIRHYPGHSYHVHVRFTCPETDKRCSHSNYF